MKTSIRFAIPLTLGLIAGAAQAQIVYQNDFESASTAGFTNGGITLAPNASTSFLGEFSGDPGNTSTSLVLNGLAAHTMITLSLDLFIIHSWDGNGSPGPDTLKFSADGTTTLLNATFANNPNWQQSYSDATPLGGGPFAGGTDADAINALGYNDFFGSDSTYNLTYSFAHTGSSLQLDFESLNLQAATDESWGIDNVVVRSDAVPEPATVAILSAGLLALQRRRR